MFTLIIKNNKQHWEYFQGIDDHLWAWITESKAKDY